MASAADFDLRYSYMSVSDFGFHCSEYTLIGFGLCRIEVNWSYQIATAIMRQNFAHRYRQKPAVPIDNAIARGALHRMDLFSWPQTDVQNIERQVAEYGRPSDLRY